MMALVRYIFRHHTSRCNICTPKLSLVFVLFISLQMFSRTHKYLCKIVVVGSSSGLWESCFINANAHSLFQLWGWCWHNSWQKKSWKCVRHTTVHVLQSTSTYCQLVDEYKGTNCMHIKNDVHYGYYGNNQYFVASHYRLPCNVGHDSIYSVTV